MLYAMNNTATLTRTQSAPSRYWDIFSETFAATILYGLPNAINWCFRRIQGTISSQTLSSTVEKITKTASLFTHNPINSQTETKKRAVLFLHGLAGHPYTLIPLIDIAKKVHNLNVFSFHLSYGSTPQAIEQDQQLLKQAIDKIEIMLNEAGGFDGIIIAGHSRGALLGARQQFVENDSRVSANISLAGRLKVLPQDNCPAYTIPTINAVYDAILRQPNLPLYQIFGDKDWNASQEAMAIRPNPSYCHIVKGASHLNVLYHPETHQKFSELLTALA